MKLSIGAYLLILCVLTLVSYGVMYIVRCVRRKETLASVGMILLGVVSLGAVALIWANL